jgi:hypothetical protein
MNASTVTLADPKQASRVPVSLPWLLFGSGCLAFLYSVAVVVAEAGDPPYTRNDHWQRIGIIACPVLFNAAVVLAAVARRWIATALIAAVATGCCLLGWDIVHWDIPKLFQ